MGQQLTAHNFNSSSKQFKQ